MRYQNAAIYRWACKAVAIGHPFCSLMLILLLVIVSLFACTMMEAQSLAESNAREVGGPAESSSTNSSTNRSAVQDEHWNMSAAQKDASSEAGTHQVNGDRQDGWIHSWLRAVDTARASQPHFVAPIVTTHVMLVQQYRYDMSWQQDSPGHTVTSNYGVSRGLEIIPTTRFEVGVSPPNYVAHQSNQKDGIGDLAWQVKFRAFSAPEHKGDYFVGFFMGGSFPTGNRPNGTEHTILSPTFAAAKGLGPWDIQSTLGANLPVSGTNTLGRTVVFNTAVNYWIKGKVWPMLEQNSMFWSGGSMDGRKQVFLTPGLILGSFPLKERLRIAIGGGFQTAVTPYHQYNHRWIFSVRFPF
jgi:hypothetical protein